jgi:hypothetical protein
MIRMPTRMIGRLCIAATIRIKTAQRTLGRLERRRKAKPGGVFASGDKLPSLRVHKFPRSS